MHTWPFLVYLRLQFPFAYLSFFWYIYIIYILLLWIIFTQINLTEVCLQDRGREKQFQVHLLYIYMYVLA